MHFKVREFLESPQATTASLFNCGHLSGEKIFSKKKEYQGNLEHEIAKFN